MNLHKGVSIKNSLGYTYFLDHRDDSSIPLEGWALKLNTELAGLGGDARFWKQEITAGWHKIIVPSLDLSIGCTAKLGFIQPLFESRVHLNDRFFLGGSNMRGFHERKAAGVIQDDKALGGNFLGTTSLTLTAPATNAFLQSLDVHFFAFVTAGNLINHMDVSTLREGLTLFARQMRVSAGLGFKAGRGELFLSSPILSYANDRPAWVQLSFDLSYG